MDSGATTKAILTRLHIIFLPDMETGKSVCLYTHYLYITDTTAAVIELYYWCY